MGPTDVYFCGSIRGGQDDIDVYRKMIEEIESHGLTVPTRHVGAPRHDNGETCLSETDIYERDMAWLRASKCMIAEISQPSHGVGFEVAMGVVLEMPVLALWRKGAEKEASAMIKGCPKVEFREYLGLEDGIHLIREFLEKHKMMPQ